MISQTEIKAELVHSKLTEEKEGQKWRYKTPHLKKSAHAIPVHKTAMALLKKEAVVTGTLIAKILGFSVWEVNKILTAFIKAGFYERTERIQRDESGRKIKTFYDYKLTELGKNWDYAKIPFYIWGYGKTLDMIAQDEKDKKRDLDRYFVKIRKQKSAMKSKGDKKSVMSGIQLNTPHINILSIISSVPTL
jgi:hypothetical protein